MKHKTWGEMVQSRDLEAMDLQPNKRDTEEGHDITDQQAARDKRNNIVYTRLLVAASFVCGVVAAQRGPSILDLGVVTGSTSLRPTVSLFAFGAVGQMLGCVGAGLLLGRLDGSALLFWVLLTMGASTLALPWCRSYGVLAGVYCLSLMCVGCVETGSYAEIAKRWKSKGGDVVQKLQLWFVVGAMISPGMTQFFLDPRYRHHDHTSQDNVTSGYNETAQSASSGAATTDVASSISIVVESTSRGSNSGNESHARAATVETNSDVQIAYIISGALALLASLLFLVSFCTRKEQSKPAPPRKRRGTPVPAHLLLHLDASMSVLLLVALFIFLVTAVEESMHQFLFTFMIREAGWSTHAAAWVTSWFWAGVLLVRAATYFAPDHLGDEVILALSCVALPCTLAGLHVSVVFSSSDGVWACVFFAGMAVSLIFPVSFTWIHTGLAQRASAVSGVVMSSSLVAGIVNPLVLGQFLHDERHEGGFTLLLTAQAVLALMVFLLLHVLSRRLLARWHQASARKSIHVAPRGGGGRGRGRGRLEEDQGLQDSEDV